MKLNFDVIVVGCGCAGMTAALYLKRAKKKVLIIEEENPGGLLNKSSNIENYPGFTKIDGPSLAAKMFEQVQQLAIPYKQGMVSDIIDNKDFKTIKINNESLTCLAVIIATGRKPKQLGLPNEAKLTGRGISWCSICDAPLFKDKEVIVIGGSNSALEESLHLVDFAKKVTLIYHGSQFKGEDILEERVVNHTRIKIIKEVIIVKFNQHNNLFSGLIIKNKKTKKETEIKADGLFIYIGFEAAARIFKKLKIKMVDNYIIVDEHMRTNINYIYACGDVIKKSLYQIVTAVSEGAIAAHSAILDLKTKK